MRVWIAIDGGDAQFFSQFNLKLFRQRIGNLHRIQLDHAGRISDMVGGQALNFRANKLFWSHFFG